MRRAQKIDAGRGWRQGGSLVAAAVLWLSAGGVAAQERIPPVPPEAQSDLEIPIWEEDSPFLDDAPEPAGSDGPRGGDADAAAPPPDVERLPLDDIADDGPAPGTPLASDPPSGKAAAPPKPAAGESVISLGAPETGEAFRIGLVPRGHVRDFLGALEPMRTALGGALDRPVEILPMASLSALIDAQAQERVDLAFYSASAFAAADRLCRCIEPLVAPAGADGTAAIHAVVVVHRDSGLTSVDDLAGRVVAAAAPDSVGGRLYQLASLQREGIDPESHFAAIRDAGTSVEAVLMVRDGIVDAAFAWSSLAGNADDGYSRGTFAVLVAEGQVDMDTLAIVWQSRPLAHGPVAVLRSVPEGDKAIVESFLSGLAARDPQSYDLLDPYYGGGYRPVEPEDYRGARLLAETDVGDAAPSPPRPVPRMRPDNLDEARGGVNETDGRNGAGYAAD